MYCKNCGNLLNEGAKFCTKCGTPRIEETISEVKVEEQPVVEQKEVVTEQVVVENNNQVVQETVQPVNNYNNQVPKKKTNVGLIIGLVVGGFFLLIVIIVVVALVLIATNTKSMVCKSNEGNITIMYGKKELIGYTADNITYDLDTQKDIAKKIGVDEYLKQFNDWFTTNTTGSCKINGKEVKKETKPSPSPTVTPSPSPTTPTVIENDTKTVGDNEYGYIDIPTNWYKFYDVDGNDSLQYSYASQFIVSLNYLDDTTHTAREYASNYYYNKQNDPNVTGVTSAMVNIGKNKEYTAYQVYMYYESDATYLVTYWFEAEDGKTHYIALEGPEKIGDKKLTDFTVIAESFRLKNDAV